MFVPQPSTPKAVTWSYAPVTVVSNYAVGLIEDVRRSIPINSNAELNQSLVSGRE